MKRRDEAGRAERGPFSTGLAGQAASQAGSQAQSSIYAQIPPLASTPPSFFFSLLYRLHVSSARCTVLSKDHLGGRRRREISRPPLPTIVSLSHAPIVFSCLPSSPTSSPSIRSRLIQDYKRRLIVKDSPSICLCLSPAFFAFCPSPTLFRIFTLHIPFAGCYLEQ